MVKIMFAVIASIALGVWVDRVAASVFAYCSFATIFFMLEDNRA